MTNVGCHLGLFKIGEEKWTNSQVCERSSFVQHFKHNLVHNIWRTVLSHYADIHWPDWASAFKFQCTQTHTTCRWPNSTHWMYLKSIFNLWSVCSLPPHRAVKLTALKMCHVNFLQHSNFISLKQLLTTHKCQVARLKYFHKSCLEHLTLI